MNIGELIACAVERSGLQQKELAAELGIHPTRISEWKKGKQTPDANEIAYFADKAGLPVLETVAEIEASLSSRYAPIWQAALGKLRAAGVAATVTLGLATSLMMIPTESRAGIQTDHGIDNVRFRQGLETPLIFGSAGFFLARLFPERR